MYMKKLPTFSGAVHFLPFQPLVWVAVLVTLGLIAFSLYAMVWVDAVLQTKQVLHWHVIFGGLWFSFGALFTQGKRKAICVCCGVVCCDSCPFSN